MGTKTISQLPELLTLPAASDWLAIVNDGATKRISVDNLLGGSATELDRFLLPGEVNYQAALQRALDSDVPVITGQGRTYQITGNLTGRANKMLRDMTLVASSLPASGFIIKWTGAEGTTLALDDDLPAQSLNVLLDVSEASAFTVGGWGYLRSTEQWTPNTGGSSGQYGEYVQIRSIAVDGRVHFYTPTLCAYATAQGATITAVATLDNIALQNVHLQCPISTLNQGALQFTRCSNVHLDRVRSFDADYAHYVFSQCAHVTLRECEATRSGGVESTDYGVRLENGCFDIAVKALRGIALRSLVDISSPGAGVSRFIRVLKCHADGVYGPGITNAGAAHELLIAFNTFNFGSIGADSTTQDGCALRCGHAAIVGNQFINTMRHGIVFEPAPLPAFAGPVQASITGNTVTRSPNSVEDEPVGIYVTKPSGACANIQTLLIADNTVGDPATDDTYSYGVYVRTGVTDPRQVHRVTISGNACKTYDQSAIRLFAEGDTIDGVTVAGNHLEVITGASPVVWALGSGSEVVKNLAITSNHLRSVSGTGIRLSGVEGALESNNTFDVPSKYLVTAGTGVVLDWRAAVEHVVDGGVETVGPADRYIVHDANGDTTLTLPSAAMYPGRELLIKTVANGAVTSGATDVQPIGSQTLGSAICPEDSPGAWAHLVSNGTAWVIMASG